MAQIVLSNMGGKTVTFTGATNPLYWNYNSLNSTLSLQLPYLHGGIPFTFKISGEGACQDKSLLFFSTRVQGTYYMVSPNPATDMITITANSTLEVQSSDSKNFTEELDFIVKIADTETGQLCSPLNR